MHGLTPVTGEWNLVREARVWDGGEEGNKWVKEQDDEQWWVKKLKKKNDDVACIINCG